MKKKMMTVKDFLAMKGIKQEVFDTMETAEIAKIYNELHENNVEAFKELQESGASSEDLTKAVETMNKEQAEKMENILLTLAKGTEANKQQGLAIAKLLKRGTPDEGVTLKSQLVDKTKEIKDIAKKVGNGEIVLKADTVIASVADNTGAFEVAGIGQLGHKKLNASNAFPIIPISDKNMKSTIKYYDWDEATTVRAADMVAEGAVFPESTAKWKEYNLPIRKIGDTLPVTEEFFEDESMFAAELQLFLITNVDIELNDQVINGDGTGNNLTGLVASIPAYIPVASGIVDASIYDLHVKVSEDITTDRGSKYAPDVSFMNISDINLMKLKKDANNNYVMPPFVDRTGKVVDGMVVIEDNGVVANTMIIGDRKFARLYQAAGLTVSRGEINAQFVEDMMTLKVRRRVAFLIREVDKTGWRKVTSISAALVTLATP